MYSMIPVESEEFQKSYFKRKQVRKQELTIFGFKKLSSNMQGTTDVFYKKIGDEDFYFKDNGDLCERISVRVSFGEPRSRESRAMP